MLNSIEEEFHGGKKKNSKRVESRRMNSEGQWRLSGFGRGEEHIFKAQAAEVEMMAERG